MTVPRRAFLGGLGLGGLGLGGVGLAGLGASGLLTGCADDGDLLGTVRVAVVWSGAELAAFRDALRGFTRDRRWAVSVVSLGDDAATLLTGRTARAVAPDVAVLPQPTLIRDSDRLEDLSGQPRPAGVAPMWNTLAEDRREVQRGVWFKTTHKSMVWYRPDVFAEHGLAPPATWSEWAELCDRLRRAGVTPLALGAADGWVLTDWFENVLLGRYPETFAALAAGGRWDSPQIRETLDVLARLWSPPGTFPAGPGRALLSQFGDSVLDVVRDRAAMVLGADFAYPIARRFGPDRPLDWFPVPADPPGAAPVLVGGDLAVLLRPAGSGGRQLIDWLAGPDAAAGWARAGGFVSLLPAVTDYPAVYRDLPARVRTGPALGYDLSDRLTGRLAGGDGRRGLSWVLQGLLRGLGRRERPEDVALRAATWLDGASRADR